MIGNDIFFNFNKNIVLLYYLVFYEYSQNLNNKIKKKIVAIFTLIYLFNFNKDSLD